MVRKIIISAVTGTLGLVLFVIVALPATATAQSGNQAPDGIPAEPIVPVGTTGFPYSKVFDITGYYSPLPGQQRYATGNYESEIRLNGRGTNGASGKEVYPGMVAAPSVYPFGTKLYIPGIGTAAVYDRGGAIVSTDSEKGHKIRLTHDRLDIWTGFGDKGLERALGWGRRTVTVTVYGVDPSIQENVYLEGYSASEKVLREIFFQPKLLPTDVWYLSTGEDVYRLQRLLKEAGYFPSAPTGFYGDETRDSVFRFQKENGIVTDLSDLGAGHGGPQTRIQLEKIFEEKKLHNLPRDALSSGSSGEEVRKLQNILNLLGYSIPETGFFDENTSKQLIEFQRDHGLIQTPSSFGAGYYGQKTHDQLEKKYVAKISQAADDPLVDVPDYLVRDLHFGDNGPSVSFLQEQLRRLNFLRIEPTGNYGPVTEHAVFKFQQSFGLAGDKKSKGAGEFGPMTRGRMNEIVATRHYHQRLIASKKMEQTALLAHATVMPEGLIFGDNGDSVKKLQEFLKQIGFLKDNEVSGFFGEKTRDALISFQKSHRIIESEQDMGAGRVGPQTKSVIEKFLATQFKIS